MKEIDAAKAPVVELIVGVYVENLKKLSPFHTGLFWGELEEFTSCTPATPIIKNKKVTLSANSIRAQLKNDSEDKVLQIQDSAFFLNWRRVSDTKYPGTENLVSEMLGLIDKFSKFCAKHEVGDFNVMTIEITKVNRYSKEDFTKLPFYTNLKKAIPHFDSVNLSFNRSKEKYSSSIAISEGDPPTIQNTGYMSGEVEDLKGSFMKLNTILNDNFMEFDPNCLEKYK